jgi:hypothetical protein
MNHRWLLALALVTASLEGQTLPGALSDMKGVCSVVATPKELRLINATAMLVANQELLQNSDGTISVDNTGPLTYVLFGNDLYGYCTDSIMYGENHLIAQASRTAFLIDSDYFDGSTHGALMMTAPHDTSFSPLNYKVVFRHSKTTGEDAACDDFTWDHIPASDVYSVASVVTNIDPLTGYDYQVFKLDRTVTDRAPLKIRRSGRARVGDPIMSAHYPQRTGEKIDTAGTVISVDDSLGDDIVNNIHLFDGSSGGPDYNVNDDVVETANSRASSATLFYSTQDFCMRAIQRDSLEEAGQNSPLVDIQDLIPRAEVLVTPLDYIDKKIDLGSAPTHNSYNVETARFNSQGNPLGGELIEIQKVTWPSGPHDPSVTLSVVPDFYNVPSTGLPFEISSDISNVNSCGTWDYELNVFDVTNDQNNLIRHHLEVGYKEFSVAPTDEWVVDDLSAPYTESRTYELTNVRPTPTHVLVGRGDASLGSSVFLINGASSASFDLGPAGTASATASFTLTINAAAATATTLGVRYPGKISISHVPNTCAFASQSDPVELDVSFKRGEQKYDAAPGGGLIDGPSSGQQFGPAKRFDVDLTGESALLCVKDVDLYVGVPNPLNFAANTVPAVASTLRIVVTGTDGIPHTLWNANTTTSSNYVGEVSPLNGDSIPALFLDDSLAPPLAGTLLSVFNDMSVHGHWFIDVSTSRSGGVLVGTVALDASASKDCGL